MKIQPDADDFAFYGCLATQHFLGAKSFKALVEGCGSAREVYSVSESGLKALHPTLGAEMLASLAKGPDFKAWEKLREDCGRLNIRVTAPTREGFPGVLQALEAPPPMLFLRGEWMEADARAVALVGTRDPTEYGRAAARMLAGGLSEQGFTIVSGLALGIDAAAHSGALVRGRTLAVVGCGLDIDYPRKNRELREAIEAGGAVISEHPPGTQPHQMHFPRRNRLISALSRAVIVVEAGDKSGALLTAQDARRQGKILFAVPGPVFSPMSRGTHTLLRAGAAVATCAEDVVAVLDAGAPRARPAQRSPRPADPVTPTLEKSRRRALKPVGDRPAEAPALFDAGADREPEDPVLQLWSGDEACGLDALAARAVAENLWPSDRAAAALIESLLRLEMRGRVVRLPGPAYRRVKP